MNSPKLTCGHVAGRDPGLHGVEDRVAALAALILDRDAGVPAELAGPRVVAAAVHEVSFVVEEPAIDRRVGAARRRTEVVDLGDEFHARGLDGVEVRVGCQGVEGVDALVGEGRQLVGRHLPGAAVVDVLQPDGEREVGVVVGEVAAWLVEGLAGAVAAIGRDRGDVGRRGRRGGRRRFAGRGCRPGRCCRRPRRRSGRPGCRGALRRRRRRGAARGLADFPAGCA